jgi:hypothetical protein
MSLRVLPPHNPGFPWRCAVTKVFICLVLALRAGQMADVSGVWNLEMEWSPSGSRSTGVCKLKQDDSKLTGSCAEKSSLTGEVRDRKLTWRVQVEENGQRGQMTFEGTVDESGTTIRGTCAVVGGPTGKFTMTKQ